MVQFRLSLRAGLTPVRGLGQSTVPGPSDSPGCLKVEDGVDLLRQLRLFDLSRLGISALQDVLGGSCGLCVRGGVSKVRGPDRPALPRRPASPLTRGGTARWRPTHPPPLRQSALDLQGLAGIPPRPPPSPCARPAGPLRHDHWIFLASPAPAERLENSHPVITAASGPSQDQSGRRWGDPRERSFCRGGPRSHLVDLSFADLGERSRFRIRRPRESVAAIGHREQLGANSFPRRGRHATSARTARRVSRRLARQSTRSCAEPRVFPLAATGYGAGRTCTSSGVCDGPSGPPRVAASLRRAAASSRRKRPKLGSALGSAIRNVKNGLLRGSPQAGAPPSQSGHRGPAPRGSHRRSSRNDRRPLLPWRGMTHWC